MGKGNKRVPRVSSPSIRPLFPKETFARTQLNANDHIPPLGLT